MTLTPHDRHQAVTAALHRCADRLEQPGAWTQGVAAKNARGQPVKPGSPTASCWCAIGMITAELPADTGLFPLASGRLHAANPGLRKWGGLTTWNDDPDQTQAAVVAAFRRAAAAEPTA